MAKDCMGGIRDPDWLDLPPINSLGMGVHSLANLPSNSTIKKKAAIIIMAVEVNTTKNEKQIVTLSSSLLPEDTKTKKQCCLNTHKLHLSSPFRNRR